MSAPENCKDGASKSKSDDGDGLCEVNDMLINMSTVDNDKSNTCANCGKEGSSDEINNMCKLQRCL